MSAGGAPVNPLELRLGIVSRTATYWPLYLAEDDGLFAREGLAAELEVLGGTSAGVAALLDARVDVAATCPDAVIEAIERGAPLAIAGGLVDAPVASLVARADVADIAALRGRRVAFTEARGSVSLFLRALLRRHGLGENDYAAMVCGTTPAQAEALAAGKVDAAMLTHPFDAALLARGLRRLAHVGEELGPCAFTTLNVRRGWTTDATWPRLRAALDAAVSRLRDRSRRAASLDVLARATDVERSALGDTYERCVAEGALARDAAVDRGGLSRLLALMRAEGHAISTDAGTYLERAPQARSSRKGRSAESAERARFET